MKEFDTAQVEQLKTIGAHLHQERQERAVSLDEIAVKTYIPLRLLQALELGQVERLPEPVFVQGFIRRYADAIGLDGTALSKTFSPQASFVVERHSLEPESKATAEPRVTKAAPIETLLQAPPNDAPRSQRSYLPYVLLGTTAVLLLGAGLLSTLNRPKTDTESPRSEAIATPSSSPSAPAQPSLAPQSTASAPNVVTPSPTLPSAGTAANAPIQVAVNLTGESWLQVIADGKTEFEGILQKGDQRTWTAKKALVLQSGNAGAVSVSYNKGEAKPLGAPGEVKDLTFTNRANEQPSPAN